MNNVISILGAKLRRYRAAEDGTATLSFVIAVPIFMFIWLMTIESGIVNLRKFMVEHAVDRAVRDVRVGNLIDPDADDLRERICDITQVIPNCMNDLRVEMVRRDVRNWVPVNPQVQCVNREDPDDQDEETFDQLGNNQLMYLRVCARVNPFMPSTGLGLRLVEASEGDAAAAGSYAIISSAAFVVEPFRAEEDG
ncbi:MAG: pilus assembly protein [Pseudomonadota bacterium]